MVNYEFPPIGGGGGTTTRFLAKYMSKLGVDVSVLTARPQKENFYNHPEGFKIYYVGPVKHKLTTTHIPELARFALTTIFYSKNVLKIIKPDLIHCFFAIPSGCFGLYCKKVFNIPYITSALGADVPGFNIGDWRLNTYHIITQSFSKAIWENSLHVVANSTSLKTLCENFSQNQKIEVITNGVDSEMFYPKENKMISKNEIRLLYLSRLTFQKGIETLIKALGILKERNINNYKLTVVGEGHLKDSMFNLIDKFNMREKVDFLGWKKLEETPEVYRNSDVFILPSVMEGMPSVALQAMSCGLPLIASRVSGFEQILEEEINGYFAGFNNPEEFANAIEKLLKSPELIEKMSRESTRKARQFSWERISEQYLELYEKSVYGNVTKEKIKEEVKI